MVRNTVRRLFAAFVLIAIGWAAGMLVIGSDGLLSDLALRVLPLGCVRAFASYPAQYDCEDIGFVGVFAFWGLAASALTLLVCAVATWNGRAAGPRREAARPDPDD
ncbi:hypothetical protein ACFPZ0_11905 [Streptomonospora nanhaiensis]|uniref:Transmembrane protein n=1 Tax=Streptomonospora nanhaiensis TaxID=1323731 RepID=A0A853BL80_9ACTN|nr:hypothetical protein [Streptomonospora nanhaiensis]MBV2362950.1 hypothetical protein [Streptomonospora nanhaiensis]MBX9388955.1 hypothetical protein [Streptomonospora nanhaiensis]NYI95316.1 hypothetical protein [Streptomonospora nanhaiensis]